VLTDELRMQVRVMPQVSVYLDEEVLSAARQWASRENLSLSKYISNALMDKADVGWPSGYWDLFGSLADDSFEIATDVAFNEVAGEKVSYS
jgi:hypothetical protein